MEARDEVKGKLAELGITAQVHYPKSLPELLPYQDRFTAEDFPVAKKLGERGLSLPMYAEFSQDQQDYVIEALRSVLA